MFCRYCGENLNDGSTFCPKCGKKLIDSVPINNTINLKTNNNTAIDKKTKSKLNAKKIVIIVALILIAGGLIEIGIYGGYNLYTKHTINKYIEYVKNDDFQSANNMYYNKLENNNKYVKNIIKELDTYLDDIKNDMYNGSKTYDECMNNIETVNKLGIEYLSTSIIHASDYIQEVNQNNLLVSQGDSCFNNKDYINAISVYSNIKNENISNYNEIQDKISKSQELLVQEVKDKTKTLRNEKKYDEAINLIKVAFESVPNSDELNSLNEEIKEEYRQYYIDNILSEAKDSVSSKDIDKMLSSLEKIYNGFSIYDDISNEKNVNEAKKVCLEGIKSKINECIKKSDVENASIIVNDALKILPDDEQDYFSAEQSQILNLITSHSDELISKNKDYSGALEYLQKMSELNPNNTDIFNKYQSMFNEQSKFETTWNGTIATKEKKGVTLRKLASSTSEEVTHVDDNETVSVTEMFGEWYKVNYKGNEGYILKSYVKNYG